MDEDLRWNLAKTHSIRVIVHKTADLDEKIIRNNKKSLSGAGIKE